MQTTYGDTAEAFERIGSAEHVEYHTAVVVESVRGKEFKGSVDDEVRIERKGGRRLKVGVENHDFTLPTIASQKRSRIQNGNEEVVEDRGGMSVWSNMVRSRSLAGQDLQLKEARLTGLVPGTVSRG